MRRVAIDTETTGLERGSRAVELAAVIFDDATLEIDQQRSWLINPGMPIPEDVTKIHGITDDMVATSQDAGTVLAELIDWLPADLCLVAHNAPYDAGIISWDAARCGIDLPPWQIFDTVSISKAIAVTKKNGLKDLVLHYGIIVEGDEHRAGRDALCCAKYFAAVAGQHNVGPVAWNDVGHDYAYTDTFPPELMELPTLVAHGGALTFAYEDKDGEASERTVSPYGWATIKGELYFHGHCHLREARRSFKADRIRAVLQAA